MKKIFLAILINICLGLIHASGAELVSGGSSGGPKEAEELNFNTKFMFANPPEGDAAKVAAWTEKYVEPYRKIGISNIWIYAFQPARAAVFSEYIESGRKYKALETGYSFAGALGTNWLALVAKTAALKLPLVYNFVPDELYYNNGHIPYAFGAPLNPKTPWYPDTAEEKNLFKAATGCAFPRVTVSRFLGGDTKENRAFIIHRYRTLAKTVKAWYAQARQIYPDIQTAAMLNLKDVYGLERYPGGMALDMFGEDAGLTYVSATSFQCSYDWRGPDTHYYPTETVKHLGAGFPAAKVICWTSASVWAPDSNELRFLLPVETFPKLRPIDLLGTAVSSIGHGAEGYMPYGGGMRDNKNPDSWETQKQLFHMIREISPWVEGSKVPGRIVVLHSRAGEDWYALANESTNVDALADGSMAMRERCEYIQQNNYLSYHLNKDAEQSRGYRAHKAVMHFLFKNAMPFQLYYLDTLEEKQLAEAKLIILPFAHSISKAAAEMLKRNAQAGKWIAIFGMLGERDPEGNLYPVPLLADLAGQANVRFFSKDTTSNLSNPKTISAVRKAFREILATNAPVQFVSEPGVEIEVALREKSPAEKILFLVNWSEKSAKVSLKLPMPEGNYRLAAHNMIKMEPFGKKQTYTAADLAALAIPMAPYSALVIRTALAKP
jgi:hypothetical protein